MKIKNLFYGLAVALIIMAPVPINADTTDVLSKFHPYLIFQESYSDNLFLRQNNTTSDWLTTVGLGLRFNTSPVSSFVPGQILEVAPNMGRSGVDLDFNVAPVFYAKNSQYNYTSYAGRLNSWYTFDNGLTIRMVDYVIQSETPQETAYQPGAAPGQYFPGTTPDRSIWLRNVFSPSLEYRFGREDIFSLTYRNNYYQNQSSFSENSIGNTINPLLTYWFDIRNGMTLEYAFTDGTFEKSPNFINNFARGRYTYRFDPQKSIFVQGNFTKQNYESPGINYSVQNPSIGVEYFLTPTLSGVAQIGYYWYTPDQGKSNNGITANIGLTQKTERSTFNLTFRGGYLLDYFTATNSGFIQSYGGYGIISHRLTERFTVGINGSLVKNYYPASEQTAWYWRAGGNASYRILRWLSVSADYYYQNNDSNQDGLSYSENRLTLMLKATM
jgi:hypothetical protein